MISGKMMLEMKGADNLKKSLVNKIMRKAVKEAMKPTQLAVKSNASTYKRYGFLAKSISNKIKTYPSGVFAIIGPKSKYVKTVGNRRYRPAYYAHFLESGFRSKSARPILKPALAQTKNPYLKKVAQLIAKGIAEELAKAP